MDVATVPPLQLGFVGEIEKQPIETEAGGSNPARGKKRPPSPPGCDEEPSSDDDEESSSDDDSDDDDEWLVSDSGGEDCDQDENQGKTLNNPLLCFASFLLCKIWSCNSV